MQVNERREMRLSRFLGVCRPLQTSSAEVVHSLGTLLPSGEKCHVSFLMVTLVARRGTWHSSVLLSVTGGTGWDLNLQGRGSFQRPTESAVGILRTDPRTILAGWDTDVVGSAVSATKALASALVCEPHRGLFFWQAGVSA